MLQYNIKNSGSTLIEVLIALLLLSGGLLLAGMQSIKALQLSRESLTQAKALILCESAKESLSDNLGFYDIQSLQKSASLNLPQGSGQLKVDKQLITVGVSWHSTLKNDFQSLSLRFSSPEVR